MIDEETTATPRPVARSAGAGNSRRYALGNLVSFLLEGEDTGGRFMLMELIERKGKAQPRHVHHREDEILFVLEGEITVEVEDEVIYAPAGTLTFLPRGTEHGFAAELEQAKLLVMALPAGLEGYFEEISRPDGSVEIFSEPEVVPGSEKLASIAMKYGIEITGPPVQPGR
ncbi:MAG: cupin domain-containing protein [Rubrobacter sp.]